MSTELLRSFAAETLNSEKADDRWRIYRVLRKENGSIAAKTWRELLNDSEKRNFLNQWNQTEPETTPAHGLKGLITRNLWEKDAPPYIEPKVLLVLIGASPNKDTISMLVGQHRVNYHGHLCVSVEDGSGKTPEWDLEESAFRVEERSQITVVAYLNSSAADLPTGTIHEEMEVSEGSDRPLVPFQVEVDGYPLRFLERSKHDKILVPTQGQSEVMRFPIHPESLKLFSEENRVPVWVNCRQNNSLVQCVCAPLLIIARKKKRSAAKKAKS